MSSTIYTIPPNLPLIREACGKVLPCIAAQSYILGALNYTLEILNKRVRNFDAVSYHRGNPNRISSFFMVAGGGLVSSTISQLYKKNRRISPSVVVVPRTRLELTRACAHHPLKVACLPISPPGHFPYLQAQR